MESAKNAMSFSIEPLKEPRGFIKIIQWILSIFAFATAVSVDERVAFYSQCNTPDGIPGNQSHIATVQIAYPFDLHNEYFLVPLCSDLEDPHRMALQEGARSSAEFYVFVGVFVFLYCLAALAVYLLFDEVYRSNTNLATADFIISVVLTLFWLIGSSAWAQGLVNLKYYTDFKECGQFDMIEDCKYPKVCVQSQFPNFASLNVSVIFGFLNMVVWAGNLWFLYKETPWFKVRSKPPQEPTTDPQRI